MDPGELSLILLGESHIFDDGALHAGFAVEPMGHLIKCAQWAALMLQSWLLSVGALGGEETNNTHKALGCVLISISILRNLLKHLFGLSK